MQRNVEKFGISDKRGRTPKNLDPYQIEDVLAEPAICQKCHVLYQGKRWQFNSVKVEALYNDKSVMWVTCPACAKIEDHYPVGFVTLRGDYLMEHEEEIRNLIHNKVEADLSKNPMARIMSMMLVDGDLVIETTEQKLAEHIGRTLESAHSGELHVTWSQSPKICRVVWER